MRMRPLALLTTLAIVSATFATGVSAEELVLAPEGTSKDVIESESGSYIVVMEGDPVVVAVGQDGLDTAAAEAIADDLEEVQDEVLADIGADAGDKVNTYTSALNGFSSFLTYEEAQTLAADPKVQLVLPDELHQATTDSSPAYLGLTRRGGAYDAGITGEDVVVGVIDNGIWPEHPSFADEETPKKGNKGPDIPFGPIPAGFDPSGCDFGNTAMNPLDAPFECNNKLIAARCYNSGFSDDRGESYPCGGDGVALIPSEFHSARDNDGHGSHTASTAGGNYGVPAAIGGTPLGMVSGMAPRARIAAYKVCWNGSFPPEGFGGGCYSSDSAAAIDQAVADGVDVINFSIGGGGTNFNGADDIAFLFAADAGVFVATSQGNAGPGAQTTGTPAGVPWITAVGAIEDDQVFGTGLLVSDPASIADLYGGLEGTGPVRLADTGDITASVVPAEPHNGCGPLTNPGDIAGNIALVIRGACSFKTKYDNAADAGAQAIVVYNSGADASFMDPIYMGGLDGVTIPGIMIGYLDGDLINTTAAGETVTGTVGPSIVIPRENRIADFSSRGPNGGAPDIIKPDVVAPGVQILAAQTPDPNDGQTPGEYFQIIGGTSMASPHVAGAFALLKQAHPDWTAAMAKSALMTTARQDLMKTWGDIPADPFDMGAGHIMPNGAFDPGLAYDADIFDYVRFTCGSEFQSNIFTQGTCDSFGSIDSSDLNLPSIGIGDLVGVQTITRTVTAVYNNNGNTNFNVSVDAPPGIDVSVSPSSFKLRKGQSMTFEVTFTVTGTATLDEWAFGSLTWTGGPYSVRSPIAVRPTALSAPSDVSGAGTDGSLNYDVGFGYNGDFNATMDGLDEGEGQPDVVADGGNTLHFFFVPPGTTLARFSLFDDEIGAQNDLDLQIQGPDSAGYPFVCSSGTGSSEEQCDLVNPAPGWYAAFVIDFESDPGPTAYTLWYFNLDGTDAGNTTITAPASAVSGTSGNVTIGWAGLTPGARHLGIVSYDDGVNPLSSQTEVMIKP